MYRACSTWQYEVVAELIERHKGGRRLGYLTADHYRDLNRSDAAGRGSPSATEWRVFKSHEGDRRFAAALARGQARAVYAYRDVRDVVFSLMHKRGLSFEQLLRQGMIHQILANDRFWTRQPNVVIQRYDDLLADPARGVVELACHLGIALEDGEAARVARAYSLESNKARTAALRQRLEQGGVDLTDAANSQICDSTTLLHWNHVRDGSSGSWLAQATPGQRGVLDWLCRRWLEERKYDSVPVGASAGCPPRGTEALRMQLDLATGWLNFQIRQVSQRFPRLASAVKRMLGLHSPEHVGATVWAGSAEGPGSRSTTRAGSNSRGGQ
jgi:hypothetical protein